MAGRYPKQFWQSGTILPPYGPVSGGRLSHLEDWMETIFDDFDNHLVAGNAHPVYILKPGAPTTDGVILFNGSDYVCIKIDKDNIAASAGILKSQLENLGITNADVAAGAGIIKSKLAALGIVDADVDVISASKLANYPNDASKRLAGDGSWQPNVSPQPVPIDLTNPASQVSPGNCYPAVATLTAHERWHWQFSQDVIGILYGQVLVPEGFTSPKIKLALAANATTGVTRMAVATKAIADGESLNPAALTFETSQEITVPATARNLKMVTFALANETLSQNDLLEVEIYHDGTHTNDTLAVPTELHGAWLLPS